MQVSITFRHMTASEALREHVDARINSLQKYFIKPIEIHAVLSVEKIRHRAEVVLHEQNFKASADEVSDDMYKSIDKALDRIESQVKKHKAKAQEHHKGHSGLSDIAALAEKKFDKIQG